MLPDVYCDHFDRRKNLTRLRAAAASLTHAIERKTVLVDLLQRRGLIKPHATARLWLDCYRERLADLTDEIARTLSAELAAYTARINRQIPMVPSDSLDQESTRHVIEPMDLVKYLDQMHLAEETAQPNPIIDDSEAA